MEFLRRLQEQLRQIWRGMSVPRRVALALVTLVSVLAIAAVVYWAGQAEYRTLYSGLAPEDAAAVTARLTQQSIPYRLSNNGTTISVPAEQLAQVRIDLAAEGLPTKGGKGFELFDESPLGMTPFVQHVNYLRALQGELAKTIQRLEPVSQARVHITQPEPSPFVRDQKPPTASVVVWLKPNATLNRSMANGIVALVANSTEGLTPENVTLLDNFGHILSERQGPEAGQVPQTQLEYRREIENALAAKAEGMLAQVLGPGRAIVRVTADVNFRKVQETRETYSPDDKVITSETVTSVKSTGAGPGARGVVGFTSNATARGAAAATTVPPESKSTSSEDITDTKYAVSKTVQKVEDRIGNVERLSVAAMVDLHGEGGEPGPSLTVKDVEDIVKRAVGFRTPRDEIKVSDVRLVGVVPQAEAQAEYEQAQRWQYYINLVRNGSLGLAAVVALVLGILFLRRLRPARPVAPAVDVTERTRRLQGLALTVQQNPDRAARALDTWLGPAPAAGRAGA
jgi:flagellar M-ring protein FliF